MILYGMGFTAGLVAFAGFFWALWRIARLRADWMAHALPVAWSGSYFVFMGTRWVQSIRYFLPIYPSSSCWAPGRWSRSGHSGARRCLRRAAAGALVVV